jgi:aryl-alcohol dehydrogenase-like predicted oxidoreductase
MTNQITLRTLGRLDLKVTPIGLGCWQFSKRGNLAGKFRPLLSDEVIREIVQVSLEGGISWFDTADVYGQGASEKSLARSLVASGRKPGDVIIATKWWPILLSPQLLQESPVGQKVLQIVPRARGLPFEFRLSGNRRRMNFQ